MTAHPIHFANDPRKPSSNGDAIVTGGGHVYPYTSHELMDYRDRFCPADVQKQRGFQAKVEVAKKEKKKRADPRKNHGKTRLSKFYRDRLTFTNPGIASPPRLPSTPYTGTTVVATPAYQYDDAGCRGRPAHHA